MSQPERLYEASLDEGWQETRTYDINRLFLVAFFGGVIPMVALGTRNAKWLGAQKNAVYALVAAGAVMLTAKIVLVAMVSAETGPIDKDMIKYGYKIGSVLLFLGYKFLLNKPFQQHLVTGSKVEPLLGSALKWIVIGVIVEAALIIGLSSV
ncbi:hypothetical protein [Bacillus marinisedimentorum]|uniref:hypothetical protein n=1 Tax=Bacillus marinisedimentorum TaxID=1821260 RepID=UPI0008721AFD|nr:hypothetical protein [Bacillus marinisedimentorum]